MKISSGKAGCCYALRAAAGILSRHHGRDVRPAVLYAVLAPLLLLGSTQVTRCQSVEESGTVSVSTQTPGRLNALVETPLDLNFGYYPVIVTVRNSQPSPANRYLTVRISVQSTSRGADALRVEQDFQLNIGEKETSTTVAVPIPDENSVLRWDLSIDGMRNQRNSRSLGVPFESTTGGVYLTVLAAESPTSSQTQFSSSRLSTISRLKLEDFFTRWIDYSSLDVVLLSPTELQNLADRNPAALTAVKRWVRSGGSLWITSAGAKWHELERVEQVLGIPRELRTPSAGGSDRVDSSYGREEAASPPAEPDAPEDTDSPDAVSVAADLVTSLSSRGWQFPTVWGSQESQEAGRRFIMFQNLLTGEIFGAEAAAIVRKLSTDANYRRMAPQAGDAAGETRYDSREWFATRPLGLGKVVAFRAHPDQTPQIPFEAITHTWPQRHGLLPGQANADYFNWLVPGVAEAPVTEFQVLITLFVLVIGPLNFWLLKRAHRLQLMVLTVPAAALATTLALFVYAFISDGFSTRVRVQSLTHLDQRTGEAACWARLSYYSGLAPRDGLLFPEDMVIYPITPPQWAQIDSARSGQSEMLWDEGQHLRSGWLSSRTPRQFLSIRSRTTPHRLEFTGEGESATGSMSVANALGTHVEQLVVVDSDGALHLAQSLPEGQSQELAPVSRAEALDRLRRAVLELQPYASPQLDALGGRFRQRPIVRQRTDGTQITYGSLDEGLMNTSLAELLGNTGQAPLQLPPRSYVALTRTGPEVALGIPGAGEEASFHVIIGRW